MAFAFDEFYRLNRRVMIWIILAALLWLLRDFFDLIFLTFALIFVATPLVRLGEKWLRLPYRGALVVVYLLFLLLLGTFVRYITPNIINEANQFVANLGTVKGRIVEIKDNVADRYPGLNRVMRGYMQSLLSEDAEKNFQLHMAAERGRLGISEAQLNAYYYGGLTDPEVMTKIEEYVTVEDGVLVNSVLAQLISLAREHSPKLINLLYKVLETLLLSLLFSFLILIDIVSLKKQTQNLKLSRLSDFYQEAAQPVARFGYVIGRAIQAQAMIALVNTALTLAGLLILSIPSAAALSLIVFVCGFIPVLGTFISTVPIALAALNAGGLQLMLVILLLIVIIHVLEAYVLNPLIYGRHFKLNPVIVLIILFVGYHLFGIWGVLLGVPVTQYFMHHVFGIQVWREDRLGAG
jgi:predicted PurR-regulated permease PerM